MHHIPGESYEDDEDEPWYDVARLVPCRIYAVGSLTTELPLLYAVSAPHEVTFRFDESDHTYDWVMGLELLKEGLEQRAGEGDIQFEPGISDLRVTLSSASISMAVYMDIAAVRDFIMATQQPDILLRVQEVLDRDLEPDIRSWLQD